MNHTLRGMVRRTVCCVTVLNVLGAAACGLASEKPSLASVVPNDNRQAAGTLRGDTLVFTLTARLAAWRPDSAVDSSLTVQAFASDNGVPRIPGPLLRVTAGTMVEIHVSNHFADSALVVHGLRPGSGVVDTVQVAAGATRTVYFAANTPGTYLYWGRSGGDVMERSELRDGPLAGAIVVDSAGAPRDTTERIFVITTVDIVPDSTKPELHDDLFELAINGLSWPNTETLHHVVGDTVRWRLVNATATPHPMHLHGFHFAVVASGNGSVDTAYRSDQRRTEVTEHLRAGSTAQLRWTPTRTGNWLFHCHITGHVTPFPIRADSVRAAMEMTPAAMAEPAMHMARSMSGLVMGIEVRDRDAAVSTLTVGPIAHQLRLFAQQASTPAVADTAYPRGYALQQGTAAPNIDSVVIPGPVLFLTRGERTAITVTNRLPEPTSVHWHGMELENYYDGVIGWSRADAKRSPMIAPGDSFVAVMSPPRAGTFMYHPHMDEEDQLEAGMYGPMIVLEPGQKFNPATDLIFMFGMAIVNGERGEAMNGARTFAPLSLIANVTYRLRFLNMNSASPVAVLLHVDSVPLRWQALAKDGADVPEAQRGEQRSQLTRLGVGETYDFTWRPTRPLRAVLEMKALDADAPFRVPIVVR